MDIEVNRQKRFKISKISIFSFISLVVGLITYVLGFIVSGGGYIAKSNEHYLMVLSLILWTAAFALGITDIFKKERNKVLSIVTVIISGIPLTLFLLILCIMIVFGK